MLADDDLVVAWQGDRGVFTNTAVVLAADPDWDALIARVDGIVPDDRPVLLVTAGTTPTSFGPAWHFVGRPPLMVRAAGGAVDVADLGVHLVADRHALAEFERTLVEGYPDPTLQPYRFGDVYDGRVLGGATRFYAADADGGTVATASGHVAAGVNLVEMVATRAEWRGRGFGAAVTWAAATTDAVLAGGAHRQRPRPPGVRAARLRGGQPLDVVAAAGEDPRLTRTPWHAPRGDEAATIGAPDARHRPERPPSHRQLFSAGARALIGAAVLVTAYYIVPESLESAPSVVLRIVVTGIVVAVMLGWQVRAIVDAELPLLRAMEALALTVTLMVVGFASFYIQVSKRDPTAFNEVLNRTGALYFTMTTLATIGYGDIHARTDGAVSPSWCRCCSTWW